MHHVLSDCRCHAPCTLCKRLSLSCTMHRFQAIVAGMHLALSDCRCHPPCTISYKRLSLPCTMHHVLSDYRLHAPCTLLNRLSLICIHQLCIWFNEACCLCSMSIFHAFQTISTSLHRKSNNEDGHLLLHLRMVTATHRERWSREAPKST